MARRIRPRRFPDAHLFPFFSGFTVVAVVVVVVVVVVLYQMKPVWLPTDFGVEFYRDPENSVKLGKPVSKRLEPRTKP